MGAPAVQVEIAFDSNFTTPAVDRTWTDVSEYLRGTVYLSYGRSDPVSQVGPSTCTVQLRNEDGRFTAGKASSPYYPDVKLDRPLRVTVTPDGGSPSVRFLGYIDAWPTEWPMGTDLGSVTTTVSATSRMGRMAARNTLEATVVESAKLTSAVQVWRLNDQTDSLFAAPVFDNEWGPLSVVGTGYPLTFGGDWVQFSGGQYLSGGSIDPAAMPQFTLAATFVATGQPTLQGYSGIFSNFGLATGSSLIDGQQHRMMVVYDTGTYEAFLDGVSQGTESHDGSVLPLLAGIGFIGLIRDLTLWPTLLTAPDIETDYLASTGLVGLTTSEALELLAAYGQIPPAELDVPAVGATTMGGLDLSGLALLDAMRVVESTEGGLLLDGRTGLLVLQARRARFGSSPTVTVAMDDEEVATDYSPVLDRGLLRNDVTGTNAATSFGEAFSYRVIDAASQAEYGVAGGSVEVNAANPEEANAAASWIVAKYSQPQPRVPQMSVDLLGLNDGARVDAFLTAFIGDRIRLEGRPSQDSTSEVELFIEGGSETYAPDAASLTWNLSPVTVEDSLFVIDTDSINGPAFIAY